MVICTQQKRASILKDVTSQEIKGVLTDNNLSWKQHTEHLCVELSKLIGLLWRKKHFLPYSSLVLFHNSYILPVLITVSLSGGKASAIHLGKMWRLLQ